MKLQNLKTKLIAPTLLLIPMACMHLGDDHHSGHHHFSLHQQSHQSSSHGLSTGGMMGEMGMTTHQGDGDSRHQGPETPASDQ